MKISRSWLQTYFESELPEIGAIADALTFHAFEIESVENDILGVKITANRGHDCLSHRGIAKELSAILGIPLKQHPLPLGVAAGEVRPPQILGKSDFPKGEELRVVIDDPKLCRRYIGAHVRGVKVGPSPAWLASRLESIGQKSINNVVDAANFVMFDIGQPLHAFDASTIGRNSDGLLEIEVRDALIHENITDLSGDEHVLEPGDLVIGSWRCDQNNPAPGETPFALAIAGIKGGMESGTTPETADLVLEAANFRGSEIRKTARRLKLRSDASQRFEQGISPELAADGMQAFVELVLQVAGGELVGVVDEYPEKREALIVSVSLSHINRVLGLELSAEDVRNVFARLGLEPEDKGEPFIFGVKVPSERLDIVIPEDLIEEVGRIIGYDKVPAIELPVAGAIEPDAHGEKYAAIREHLSAQGFSEVFTSVFAEKGERAVSNKVGGDRPYLRSNLHEELADALERNIRNKDLLGISQVKLFEIGTVWRDGEEKTEVAIAVEKIKKQKTQEDYQKELDAFISSASSFEPRTSSLPDVRYEPFSRYPFITRDIALWVSEGTSADEVLDVIRHHAGELLVRSAKFDEFTKEGRTSYAFRLVFQSMDRTLFDGDANARMESVYAAAKERGWEVR